MYDPKTNEILFPLILHGSTLGGKKHDYNSINGGFKQIADLNLIRNSFYGGNVVKLGFIREYGFFACPHYEQEKTIVGFYIHDPSLVTELGKKLIQERYPNAKVVYEQITVSAQRVMTQEEITKKRDLTKKAVEHGATPDQVTSLTAEELDGFLKASASGVNPKAKVSVEQVHQTVEIVPIEIIKR
jgi:hypothetical protein